MIGCVDSGVGAGVGVSVVAGVVVVVGDRPGNPECVPSFGLAISLADIYFYPTKSRE